MTIVATTVFHAYQGATWDDIQRCLAKGIELATKHGAENVTPMVTTVGGPATNTLILMATSPDWATHGQRVAALNADPEMMALRIDVAKLGTTEAYLSETIQV
jgi:hypothetical protein